MAPFNSPEMLLRMLQQQGRTPLAWPDLPPGNPAQINSNSVATPGSAVNTESSGMLAPAGAAPGGQGTALNVKADTLPPSLRTSGDVEPGSISADDFLKSLPSPSAIPSISQPNFPQEPNYPAPPQMAPPRTDFTGRLVAGLSGLARQPNPFDVQREQRFKDALANWQAQVSPMRERYQEQLQQAELGPRLQGQQINNALALRRIAMMSGGGGGMEAIRALGQLDPNEQAMVRGAMSEGDPKALAQTIDHIVIQRNITGRSAMLARQTMGNVLAKAGATPEMDLKATTAKLKEAVSLGKITPKEYQDAQSFLTTQPFLPGARLSYAETFITPREELNRILQGGLNLRQGEEGLRIFDPALSASTRLARMAINVPKAMAGNQQAMVALLMDHIGMTLGLQKGARITRDAILTAENSRGLVSGITSYLNFVKDPQTGEDVLNWSDPVRAGTTLTPQQISQMMDLGQAQHQVMWTNARTQAAQMRSYNVPVNEPEDIMDALAPGTALAPAPVAPQGGRGANLAASPQFAKPNKPASKQQQKPSLDDIFKPKGPS